jgi:hypothetical protein
MDNYSIRNDREANPLSALPFHLTTFKILPDILIAKLFVATFEIRELISDFNFEGY